MPSFWPWKGDDNSPAYFEKTLSDLSSKIGKASGSLETTRQRGRRFKALWTLYTSFTYILYLMIAAFVVGYQNWGSIEYTAVASAPVAIYSIRKSVSTYFDYRASNQQVYLKSLQKQRDDTIAKLKDATKYNTTQQLLEKYGGTPHKPALKPKGDRGEGQALNNAKDLRKRRETTGVVPPPTANISGRRIVSASVPGTPQFPPEHGSGHGPQPPQSAAAAVAPWREQGQMQRVYEDVANGAEFAPNAFGEPRVYAHDNDGPKWYDRLMDVVLGEDESNPKNRIALICHNCRLVNGQAPPGVKTLEDLGKWKCSACGEMNGEESEAKRIVADIQAQVHGVNPAPAPGLDPVNEPEDDAESDHTVYSEEDGPQVDEVKHAKKGKPKGTG